jgi:hypothetical protein
MPERPALFRCPICRSATCERITVRRANNSDYITSFYACVTCTVMFLDPIAFTRGFEDRAQPSARTAAKTPYAAWSAINQARKDREGDR